MDRQTQETAPGILADGLRVVTAGNASAMTYKGTNTYLLGHNEVAVIDPGPDDPEHLDAIVTAAGGAEKIRQIWVTHSHLDHSQLVPRLKAMTGATVYGYGTSSDGRAPHMQKLAATSDVGGGEGLDARFVPDVRIADGAKLEVDGLHAIAHWTPGHFCNHMSFETPFGVFTGDIVMGWASSLVSPPDGDLTAYMVSLDKLAALNAQVMFAGHGDVIDAPAKRIAWLKDHRIGREKQLIAALAETGGAHAGLGQLTARVYQDVPREMHPAAMRNLLAHLIDLELRGIVKRVGDHGTKGLYLLA